MDAISLLMGVMLMVSEPCSWLPDEHMQISGMDVKVTRLWCGDAHIRAWQRWCPDGRGFWTWPFLMEEETSGKGVYLNEFAGLQTGWHVTMNEVYFPACGA